VGMAGVGIVHEERIIGLAVQAHAPAA
jgi:hypothetical protein